MRQFRGLFVALGLLVALGGIVYWSNLNYKEGDGSSANKKDGVEPPSPKVIEMVDADITQLEFRKKGQDSTVIKRNGNVNWDITAPKVLRGDPDAMMPLLNTLTALNSESLVDDKVQDWTSYGLKDPAFEVVISKKDGKTLTLQIGDELPQGGALYARVLGETKLYTIGGYNRAALDKTWRELRDKRLITVDVDKLAKIEMQRGGAAWEVGKNAAGQWQIVKPAVYRADNFAIVEMTQKCKDAKLDPQLTDDMAAKNLSAFASAAPVGVVTFTDGAGPQQLEVRKAMEKDVAVFYAKSSLVEGVHKVGADLGAALEKGLDGYRNRKLFDFGFSDPTKVEIKVDGGPMKSYGKNGDKWFLDGKEMKPETVQNLIDKLRDLSAQKFVANPAAKLTPEIEIVVSANNTTETVRISGVVAARGEEPYQYEAGAAAVDDVRKAAAGIAVADGKKK